MFRKTRKSLIPLVAQELHLGSWGTHFCGFLSSGSLGTCRKLFKSMGSGSRSFAGTFGAGQLLLMLFP